MSIQSTFSKAVPQSKGMVQTAITGIGFDNLLKVTDSLIGSPMQRVGVSVPIVGRLSIIDFFNYLAHTKGKVMPGKDLQKGLTAVFSAKLVQTGFNFRSIVPSSTVSSNTQTGGGI